MMNKDFFYTWHKRSLRKHTEEVDIDAIWAAIEPEVDVINGERKRRRGFLFFLSFACIGIIATGFFSLFLSNSPNSIQHISNIPNTIALTEKQGTQIDKKISTSLTEVAPKVEISTPSTKHITSTQTNTLTSQSILSPSLNLKDDSTKEIVWQSSGQNSTPKVRVETPFISNQDIHLETSSLMQSKNSIKEEVKNLIVSTKNNEIREEAYLPNSLPITTNLYPHTIDANDAFPSKAIHVAKKAPIEFSVGIYSGLAFAQKTIDAKNNSDAETLSMLRSESESNLEVWNNGLKIKAKHKSGFHLSVGLQYARLAEHFQYDTDYLLIDSIANQIVGYSNNLLGDRSTVFGFSPNNTLYDLEYDFYNYYHFLEIPISLGYQKQYKSWNFGMRASYIQNISLSTKGRILDSPYSVIDLKTSDSPFRQTLQGSVEGGLTAGYRISTHFEIGLDAYLRYVPNSITKDSYSIDQKYAWTGLNASINYIF